ncbi:sensor histidine kinase [Clostridiisalibacter paucivorans]|uniref:sensor histidine kinase n=1 Tax=Clostridiisalibacter paucivorans TaxID=408753 RepID=UPI00047A1A5B|nr:HAMP domain-containing sensor histidine kinase [Clostridiisalibacter paucivorans]
MFQRLKARTTIMFLATTLVAIFLVSIIANITIFQKFNMYMEEEQEDKIKSIIELVEYAYSLDKQWNRRVLENIDVSPVINGFDIVIRDIRGDVIYNQDMTNSMMEMHRRMMGGMGHGMMDDTNTTDDYRTEIHKVFFNDKKIGTIEIGYEGPFMISEREVDFTKGINMSILYGALFSIAVAVIMGIYFSDILSKPIINITKASNKIRNGNLNIKLKEENKIIEFKELTYSINHLAKSLEEQNMFRKQLTSDISHELRTPLSILQSHTEALADGIWEPNIERMEVIRNEVYRLNKLVEQLKYVADIENHKFEITKESVNLSKLLMDIVENFRYQFVRSNVELKTDIDEEIYIMGDRDKLSQVFINIISNGLKFSKEGGFVYIELKDKKNYILVTIEDNGIGIPEEDIDYIFERFYRSEKSRNRKTGGSGVGLTIVKTIVEAHGGTIDVESKEGQGSKFMIKYYDR